MKQTWQSWAEKSCHGLKTELEVMEGGNALKSKCLVFSRGRKACRGGMGEWGSASSPLNTVQKTRSGGRGMTRQHLLPTVNYVL